MRTCCLSKLGVLLSSVLSFAILTPASFAGGFSAYPHGIYATIACQAKTKKVAPVYALVRPTTARVSTKSLLEVAKKDGDYVSIKRNGDGEEVRTKKGKVIPTEDKRYADAEGAISLTVPSDIFRADGQTEAWAKIPGKGKEYGLNCVIIENFLGRMDVAQAQADSASKPVKSKKSKKK